MTSAKTSGCLASAATPADRAAPLWSEMAIDDVTPGRSPQAGGERETAIRQTTEGRCDDGVVRSALVQGGLMKKLSRALPSCSSAVWTLRSQKLGSRKLGAVATTALIAGMLAGAAPAPPAPSAGAVSNENARQNGRQKTRPAVARGHLNTPVVDDELMVSDKKNPRILHSKRPGVIDRKWIERTAMPRLQPGLLENLDAVAPAGVGDRVLQSPEAPPLANAAISIQGHVLVVEGTSSLVVQAQQLDPRSCAGQAQFPTASTFNHANGSFDVINTVLSNLGDNYDFITVFTTFDDPCAAAYYFPLKQDIDGLGNCDFERGDTFGCLFDQTNGQLQNLQGFVFMNSLQTWRDSDVNYDGVVHGFDDFQSSVFSTLGQEVAHRWGSALRFVDPRDNEVSELLLGRDNSHWAAYVDTDASVMDGWDWSADAVDGRFELEGDMERFSTLDLYTLGALPVAAAKPFFVIDDAFFDVQGSDQLGIDGARIPADIVLQLPSDALMDQIGMNVGATGEQVPVTIQDVVNAEGNRCPDPDAAQKTFRQAVLLITRPGQSAASVAGIVADLNTTLDTWEAWWLDRTNKQLRLCTSLDGDECTHAQMSVVGGDIVHAGDSFQPGTEGTLTLTVAASGRDVENAVVTFERLGESGAFVGLPDSAVIGNIDADESATVEVPIALDASYPCGFSSLIKMTVTADNAATVVEELRTFPGLKTLSEEKFATADHGFGVNVDELDGTTEGRDGALRYTEKVELTCDMTQRSPERDASADNAGAFVTGPGTDHVPNLIDDDAGEGGELGGDTSLWSPPFNLKGTRDPEIRFAYWFDGVDPDDKLTVQLSGDGEKTFVAATTITKSIHAWTVSRVSMRDVFDGEVPDTVTARFLFEGNGQLKGGIDDVRLLDYDGECLSAARGCGCSADGEGSPSAPLAVAIGLLALVKRRKNGLQAKRVIIDGDTTPVL